MDHEAETGCRYLAPQWVKGTWFCEKCGWAKAVEDDKN